MVISCSKDVVKCASLCVACKVSVYACIVVSTGSSLDWGVGCGWSVIMRCFSLSVSCATLLYVWMGGWQVSSGRVAPEVAEIVLVTQPRNDKCQVPHCTHQMIHFLIWA